MHIKSILANGNLFTKIGKKIDYISGIFFRNIIYRFGKIQNNKLFVMTFDNNYTCNPSYIVDELLRRDADLDIVWVVNKKSRIENFPESIRLVNRGSFAMFEEMATSKVWLDNALNCVWYYMPKKENQVYINTWHGSLGIKRISGNRSWLAKARQCKRKTTYCISNSSFEDMVYRDTFWPKTPIKEFGHARNDIFFDKKLIKKITSKVHSFFGLDDDVNILLYAPTFRDDGDITCFDIDFNKLHKAIEKKFGGKWAILLRMHYKNVDKANQILEECPDVLDATQYPDMQELMVATAIGVTDYSSWAYDFVLTRRPLFIYASDREKYVDARGFYYSLESTPFPVAENNDTLMNAIESFDYNTYKDKAEEFLKGKGCIEDGNASKRCADLILESMKSDNK